MKANDTVPMKTDTQVRSAERSYILHTLFVVLWLLATFSTLAQENSGAGPEISVPRDLPNAPHSLPSPNRIDQSQAEVDRKSRGRLECHAGVEPMHVSKNV